MKATVKRVLAIFLLIVMISSFFTLNAFALVEGIVDFSVQDLGNDLCRGTTMVSAYPDEDPMTFSPFTVYAQVCLNTIVEDTDASTSSYGDTPAFAVAIGDEHPHAFWGQINSGNSYWWQS